MIIGDRADCRKGDLAFFLCSVRQKEMEKDSSNHLIPSTVASSRFGVTNDYIGLLCRQKKVQGSLFGRTWYVEPASLQKFLDEKKVEREMRHTQLSKQLRQEYQKNNSAHAP